MIVLINETNGLIWVQAKNSLAWISWIFQILFKADSYNPRITVGFLSRFKLDLPTFLRLTVGDSSYEIQPWHILSPKLISLGMSLLYCDLTCLVLFSYLLTLDSDLELEYLSLDFQREDRIGTNSTNFQNLEQSCTVHVRNKLLSWYAIINNHLNIQPYILKLPFQKGLQLV